MRQALLNLLIAGIHSVPGGRIRIQAEARRWDLCLRLICTKRGFADHQPEAEDIENLKMARQLVGLSGGVLEVLSGIGQDRTFSAKLLLPAAEQVAVLVIDDNVDTLNLLGRYLEGTRYRFFGAQDVAQVLALASEIAPALIVLDVMLPDVDGWELIGRLREHPHTRGVPIIVCTVLAQEQLAFLLGATGFIRKPITRSDFVAALDREFDRRLRGCG